MPVPLFVWGIVAVGGAVGIGGGTYRLGEELGEGVKTALWIGASGLAIYAATKAVRS